MFTAWSRIWLDPAFRSWNIEDLLPAITVPLLVLQGRDDQYGTAAQVDSIVTRTGGPATPLLLEGCGHAPRLEMPELTLEHMAAFITQSRRLRPRGPVLVPPIPATGAAPPTPGPRPAHRRPFFRAAACC